MIKIEDNSKNLFAQHLTWVNDGYDEKQVF